MGLIKLFFLKIDRIQNIIIETSNIIRCKGNNEHQFEHSLKFRHENIQEVKQINRENSN